MKLDMDMHKTLLFLCSGGHKWDDKVPAATATPSAAQENGGAAAAVGSRPAEDPTAAAAAAPAQENGGSAASGSGRPGEAEGAEEATAADSRRAAHGQATTSGRERLQHSEGNGAPVAQAVDGMTDQAGPP